MRSTCQCQRHNQGKRNGGWRAELFPDLPNANLESLSFSDGTSPPRVYLIRNPIFYFILCRTIGSGGTSPGSEGRAHKPLPSLQAAKPLPSLQIKGEVRRWRSPWLGRGPVRQSHPKEGYQGRKAVAEPREPGGPASGWLARWCRTSTESRPTMFSPRHKPQLAPCTVTRCDPLFRRLDRRHQKQVLVM